jgi:pimeloyl-ACP methyl ester carboxylesterase
MTEITSADGTAIAYDRAGEGPPVVLVSGALSSRAAEAQLAALLAPRLTVFTYDRRGRGESGDGAAYAVEREIEDLEGVLAQAGDAAGVYGTSSGANLALAAAGRGIPIAKLALWEPNFLVDESRPPLPSDYVEHLEELVGAGQRGDAVEYFMTAATGMPAEFVAPMREMGFWPSMEQAAHTLAYDGRVVDDFRLDRERVAAIDVPALVLDGGTVPWLSNGAQALADALPNARRQTLTGQQHNVAADAIAPALIEFFG